MDTSSSRGKTLKSVIHSFMHGTKISLTAEEDHLHEKRPILSDHRRRHSVDSPEIIVKIDGADDDTPSTRRRRQSSLDFRQDESMQHRFHLLEDPPPDLFRQFSNKHGSDLCLDVNSAMDALRNDRNNNNNSNNNNNNNNINNNNNSSTSHSLPPLKPYVGRSKSGRSNPPPPPPKDLHNIIVDDHRNEINDPASTTSSDNDHLHDQNFSSISRRRSMSATSSSGCESDSHVLKCTSSLQRKYSGLHRTKTKSRLLDPPETVESGQGKSEDDEEEDPLFDEDLPEEYKSKSKFDTLTFMECMSLILIVTFFFCTIFISKWKRKKFRGLHLWKWEVLILVLICGRLVSGWGIRIIVFFIERNFFMRKRILYFVYGVKRSVQNCIWFGLVLIAWHSMFDQRVEGNDEFLWYVNKILVCIIVGTLLWLAKTLMVKILASSFHVSTFFDRIQESLFNQYVIETLSGQPYIEMKQQEERNKAELWRLQKSGAAQPPEARSGGGGLTPRQGKGVSFKLDKNEEGKKQEESRVNMEKLRKMNNKNVSAWSMKKLMKAVKKGVLITLDERAQYSSGGDTQIRSECEAKRAARKIFRNVAKPNAEFIYLEDLMRFLHEEEALKTLDAVEGSTESGRISKASLKTWVVNAFIERRALALTLNDTKTAVDKLHQMVNVLVGLMIVIVFLVVLEIATRKFLLYISSQVVVVAFIFGNTCKTIFEAVIFVFVIHPFDVGDRCEIDGIQMIVEEMNILTTVFLRFDNLKIIYPNVTLATRAIGNYYRSPDMCDSVDFLVHITTPADKIAIIKQKITTYVESKQDFWYTQPSVVVMNMEQLHMLRLSVWTRHKMNHQNMGDRWKRRATLVEEMVKILKENDIEHRLCPLDVNVRAMPHVASARMPPGWSAHPHAPPPN